MKAVRTWKFKPAARKGKAVPVVVFIGVWFRLFEPALGRSTSRRKVARGFVKHARYYWLLLAESHLTRRSFGRMFQRIAGLSVPVG